jgi:hypothetical protein
MEPFARATRNKRAGRGALRSFCEWIYWKSAHAGEHISVAIVKVIVIPDEVVNGEFVLPIWGAVRAPRPLICR